MNPPKPVVKEADTKASPPPPAPTPLTLRAETAAVSHSEKPRDDQEASPEGEQEVDVWWGSYAGRTMAPSFVVCGLLTCLIIWGVWLFWPTNEDRPYLMRYTDYILIGAVWLFQLIRWGYRILGINYRLTSRRLFCQRGFHNAASRALSLTQIATVRVERLPLVYFLKVGRLRVVPADDSQPPLVLESVPYPDHVAAMIMRQVQQARQK